MNWIKAGEYGAFIMHQDIKNEEVGDHPFYFIKTNPRGAKPRTAGITEIRGQYYSVIEKLMFEAAEPAVF